MMPKIYFKFWKLQILIKVSAIKKLAMLYTKRAMISTKPQPFSLIFIMVRITFATMEEYQ
jgi:hypothetical protein